MSPRRPSRDLLICTLLFLCAVNCGDDGTTSPENSLVGTWDLIGFSDGGVEAETTGTGIFRSDGTFSFQGTITFPGEPTDNLDVEGTYRVDGDTVDLTIGQDTSTWNIEFTGAVVVLTEVEAPPANTITLRRQ